MLRLLRLAQRWSMLCPSCHRTPLDQCRCQPPSGVSIAITSAPRSASAWMPIGPSRKWLKLTTRMPLSRSSMGSSYRVELVRRLPRKRFNMPHAEVLRRRSRRGASKHAGHDRRRALEASFEARLRLAPQDEGVALDEPNGGDAAFVHS